MLVMPLEKIPKLSSRNSFIMYGQQFWVTKKLPEGGMSSVYGAYNAYTGNLICAGRTKEEIKEKVRDKYLSFIEKDVIQTKEKGQYEMAKITIGDFVRDILSKIFLYPDSIGLDYNSLNPSRYRNFLMYMHIIRLQLSSRDPLL